MRSQAVVAAAAVAALLLVCGYAFGGGTGYRPKAASDPCRAKILRHEADSTKQFEVIGMASLADAACRLHVPRGELTVALLDRGSLSDFARRHGRTEAQIEAAVRAGAHRTLDDAGRRKLADTTLLRVLGTAIDTLPLTRVIDALNGRSDPCTPIAWHHVNGQDAIYTEVALIGLTRASCTLKVAPEEFAVALTTTQDLQRFEQQHGLSNRQVEDAVRAGVKQGLDEGDSNGQIPSLQSYLLKQAVDSVPFDQLLDIVRTGKLPF